MDELRERLDRHEAVLEALVKLLPHRPDFASGADQMKGCHNRYLLDYHHHLDPASTEAQQVSNCPQVCEFCQKRTSADDKSHYLRRMATVLEKKSRPAV